MTSINELIASQKMLALLEQANRNAEAILDDFPSVFAVINSKYHIVRANRELCDLLHLSMDEILHRNFIELFNHENKAVVEHQFAQLGDITSARTVEFRADISPSNDLPPLQFLWSVAPLQVASIADGQLYALVGKDCSSIYASEAKLSGIFESLPLGILMINEEGYIEEVLSRYAEVLLETDDIIGHRLTSIIELTNDKDAEDLAMSYKRMASTAGKTINHFIELEPYYLKSFAIKRRNTFSNRWLKASYQAITHDNLVQKFMVILQDDTESVKVANERKRIDELERQSRELYECAVRDPLTGLYTRLYMDDGFNTLLNGHKFGHISALELVIFDIDNFKRINDTYGHASGDIAISAIGKIILDHSNTGAIAVRYGGDEFLVMMPEESGQQKLGLTFANAVRKQAESMELKSHDDQSMRITLSGGVISCRKNEDIQTLIQRVDTYLYQAKDSGKNTIVAEESPDEGGTQ